MAKPEWGLKRTCRDCGKRFYDFRRDPIVCPGCQAVFDPLAMLRPRRGRTSTASAAPPAADAAGGRGSGSRGGSQPPRPPPAPAAANAAGGRQTPEIEGEEEEAAVIVDDGDRDIDEDVIDSEDEDGMIKETSDLDDNDEGDDFSGVIGGGR